MKIEEKEDIHDKDSRDVSNRCIYINIAVPSQSSFSYVLFDKEDVLGIWSLDAVCLVDFQKNGICRSYGISVQAFYLHS